jgi:uncharacterized membrane protein YjfL (UPF0719 family)
LVFAALGFLAYGAGLALLARVLPGNPWRSAVEEKNVAAAILLAGIALGLGWIVAAAVH